MSMVSSEPESSPTAIICTTMGGKTGSSASGLVIDWPVRTDSAMRCVACAMTQLPEVSPTTLSAVRIGTPPEIMFAKLRVKRAMAILRTSWPKTGMLELERVDDACARHPCSCSCPTRGRRR